MILDVKTNRSPRAYAGVLNRDGAHYVNELFEAGKLEPVLDGPYPLADLPAAFRHFGTGDHLGKVVVTVA